MEGAANLPDNEFGDHHPAGEGPESPPSGGEGAGAPGFPEDPEENARLGLAAALGPENDSGRPERVEPRRTYCVRIQVRMVDVSALAGVTEVPPPEYAWNDAVVGDVIRNMIADTHEACVTRPGEAYVFFAPRYSNRGPSESEARSLARVLSTPVNWVGREARMFATAYPVDEGRRVVAAAAEREREERRAASRFGDRRRGWRDVRPRHSSLEGQDSGEDLLTGAAPEETINSPSPSPEIVHRTGLVNRGRGRLRTGALRTREASSRRPGTRETPRAPRHQADDYLTAEEDGPPEELHRARGSRGSGRSRTQQDRIQPRGKIELPVFKSTDEGAEVSYSTWRFDVTEYRKAYSDRELLRYVG